MPEPQATPSDERLAEPYLSDDECTTPQMMRKIMRLFQKGELQFVLVESAKDKEWFRQEWIKELGQRADSLEAHLAAASISPPSSPSITDEFARILADVPPEEIAKMPTDGADQHDHYIYGTAKVSPSSDAGRGARPRDDGPCDQLRGYLDHHCHTDRLPEESGRWLARAILDLDDRLKVLEPARLATPPAAPSERVVDPNVAQAHHVLDIIGIPRTCPDSDGTGESKLTLLGRMREVQSKLDRIKAAGLPIVAALKKVGQDTNWRDGNETDRVYPWYEIAPLSEAIGFTPEELQRAMVEFVIDDTDEPTQSAARAAAQGFAAGEQP